MQHKRTAKATRNVVLIAFDGVEALDVTGPASVFAKANAIRPGSYRLTVLADRRGEVATNAGISINAHGCWHSFDTQGIDTLLIPGGKAAAVKKELLREDLVRWIASTAKTTRRVASICTGVIALGHAKLLDGKRCTTHWDFWDQLKNTFPKAEVVRDQIFIRDGNIWSSGGITTGIDLALALVEDDLGRKCAVDIARILVLAGIRVSRTPQVSSLLNHQVQPGNRIKDLLPWIQQSLASHLSAEILADRAGMSIRNFNRMFTQEFGITPHNYVLKVRLEYAALLLRDTDWAIENVARKSGFISTDSLQRGFKKRWNMSPGEFRERGESHTSNTKP